VLGRLLPVENHLGVQLGLAGCHDRGRIGRDHVVLDRGDRLRVQRHGGRGNGVQLVGGAVPQVHGADADRVPDPDLLEGV